MIDLDNKNAKNIFPNLALMKLSAYHKSIGDNVEWYDQLFGGRYDIVYVSKVFSFSNDYEYFINADKIIYRGSGFAINTVNGIEIYDKDNDIHLSDKIEHFYPDYSLYNIKDSAYGFLTRGCPRNCSFCHVAKMQGLKSTKVADLSEFWTDQKNIVLLDPNITACKDKNILFEQLIKSKANVDFTQGLDMRLMTDETAEYIKQIKTKQLHFAWDNYEDGSVLLPKFEKFKSITNYDRRKLVVYVLVGKKERFVTEEDLKRIHTLREIGYYPYVMIYNKKDLPRGHELKKLQRWVNNRFIWESCRTFSEYLKGDKNE